LAQRRDELKRMHGLKQKLIAAISAASPPLKKNALSIRGLGGDVAQAHDAGLSFKLINGKSETLAWSDLGAKALPKLLPLAVDRANADDWLGAALIALTCDDVPLAEKCFDQARSLGTSIDRYLTPLASAAFARAKDLLDKKQFPQANAALEALETRYASIPWFRGRQKTIAALRGTAKIAAREADAEKLYAEAAELFGKKELYDLKPLVQRLKAEHANTRPVTGSDRKPAFAEMEKVVAKLGRRLTVRLDGKGQFRTIRAAVAAANIGDLVEIQDNGPYSESVVVPVEKSGLTLRGKKGVWPILISMEPNGVVGPLIGVAAPNTTIQRMVIVNHCASVRTVCCLSCATGLKVESVIVEARGLGQPGGAGQIWGTVSDVRFVKCLLLARVAVSQPRFGFENCVLAGDNNALENGAALEKCTVLNVNVGGPLIINFNDCIIGNLGSERGRPETTKMDHCVTYGNVAPEINAERGTGCVSANPMFGDPSNLDYRLMPGSPCIGKASDGGDIGCRCTPEMIELCKQALELRRKGILKF
jgi:hypothetical protein